MLERAWTGRRVSIRRVVGRRPGGDLEVGDVVGDLLTLRPDIAVVEARTGPVEVPVPLVVAARLVEPSTADILDLEAVAARGWRAAETEELGGWLLRANDGLTGRANSVLPLRSPGLPVEDAVEHARAWYAGRGLPLRLQLPLQARSLLDGELGERGFDAVQPDTHVLAARLDMLPADPPTVDRLDLADAPDDEWLALYGGHPAARALLTRHDQAGFARVVRDGETVAIARGAVDGDWLGIFALRVREDQQRRGLGTALLHRLWAWGRERGARRTYAQVFGGNEPGLTFFTAAGYWHHHDYRYRYPAAG